MTVRSRLTQVKRLWLVPVAVAALGLGALIGGGNFPAAAATQGPCDIYAAAGTPCVAAHSTTRALYAAYNGALYQVRRTSDSTTAEYLHAERRRVRQRRDAGLLLRGHHCTITVIFDQSGQGQQPHPSARPAGRPRGPTSGANAAALPVTAGGHKVYGVFISPGIGFRNDHTSGIATGDAAEGEYAVVRRLALQRRLLLRLRQRRDVQHRHRQRPHGGHLLRQHQGLGVRLRQRPLDHGRHGERPVLRRQPGLNSADPTVNFRFTTAIVKGKPSHWSIRGGNAQSGGLSTFYSGARPSGYNPMHKEGAILLGIGGDNSNSSAGTFYEGVMTSGYPSDTTENSVQANITAAGYSASNSTPFTSGARVSIQATTACCTADYLTHDDSDTKVVLTNVTSSSSSTAEGRRDLAGRRGPGATARASRSCRPTTSGFYIRHSGFELFLNSNDGSALFAQDATFCPRAGNSGTGYSLHVRQLLQQVHPPLQLHRLRRQRRRLQRVGCHQPVE